MLEAPRLWCPQALTPWSRLIPTKRSEDERRLSMSDSIEIVRHEGEGISTFISVKLQHDGGVVIQAVDLGDVPKRFWGSSGYEYLVDVPAAATGRLLLLLLKEKYAGNVGAVEDFREFCKSNDIAHQFSTWR